MREMTQLPSTSYLVPLTIIHHIVIVRYTIFMNHKQDETLGLRNIDAETEVKLRAIGVTSRAQFEKLGANKVYILLLEAGQKPSRPLLQKLQGAEEDIDWHILAERDKRIRRSRTADQDEP